MSATSAAEIAAMREAIALSANGLGRTSPNPPVGCVILDRDGHPVGRGWHKKAGGPHAEIEALADAGDLARGATAMVTLEPCAHQGRTGPCADALIAAGVARVVVALRDPNPAAAGGVEKLRDAGVEVITDVLTGDAEKVAGYWLIATRRGRPYVTWKFAATLDGRAAAADGTSRWISSAPAREQVHQLRALHDTIVAGVGTVLADDPALTVRLPGYTGPQPRRVIVDSSGRIPASARVLTDDLAQTWIATAKELGGAERVDLSLLMERLYADGSRALLLEGGPTLAGSMLAAGLVDRVIAYIAPKLLGAGPNAVSDMGITSITQALDLSVTELVQVGPDIRITAERK
ncbi:MAG: bifunctional diaminohydroxyphosphoribosylaminopyrimidine deaminase/5-amino-6-(5-phosphoribosylamino)uracil reductase RibD [Corynebacteriales bacterium]|nr:bifunctional diaminohydroxyphosphoribosylaminopyrimidine deaminase/5-amino-6-(5-phosphoribosylamino)uracil reductase RibD [Mycobacteriales bacterium]